MTIVSLPASPAFLIDTIMFEIGSIYSELPRGLLDAWDLAFVGKLTEANTAESEVTHVSTTTTTTEATVSSPSTELGRLF